MINNLMDALAGNDLNLRQLVKTLALKRVKPTDNADCVRLKIIKDDETIFEGLLSELLMEKLLEHYGDTEVWNFSLFFENSFVETDIFIELR
nr:MAG TPA: hypothetical protein [Caudoviricetes sp.]